MSSPSVAKPGGEICSNYLTYCSLALLLSYTCLDHGLRLIHPFMPFISEELFQRLPRRVPDAPPSICVTPYPETVGLQSSFHDCSNHTHTHTQFAPQDEALETRVKLMQEVVRNIRSMRQDYLAPKDRPEGHTIVTVAKDAPLMCAASI